MDEAQPKKTKVVRGDWAVQQRNEMKVLLEKWCQLFWGRDGRGHHVDNDVYVARHTKLYLETSDYLKSIPDIEVSK